MAIITSTGSEKVYKELEIAMENTEQKIPKWILGDNEITPEQLAQAKSIELGMWRKVADVVAEKCNKSMVFNAKVMQPELTLELLCEYLFRQAILLSVPGLPQQYAFAMVEDQVVYNWIFDFYNEDGVELLEQKEKARLKKEAEEKARKEKAEAEKKAKAKTKKKTSSKKTVKVNDDEENEDDDNESEESEDTESEEEDKHLVEKAEMPNVLMHEETDGGQISLF